MTNRSITEELRKVAEMFPSDVLPLTPHELNDQGDRSAIAFVEKVARIPLNSEIGPISKGPITDRRSLEHLDFLIMEARSIKEANP